jgi:hypothetical protein
MADAPEAFAIHVAAEACRVDRREIDRDRKRGRFPNAYFGDHGGWMIPRADLETAGYKIDSRWQRSHAAYLRNAERKRSG